VKDQIGDILDLWLAQLTVRGTFLWPEVLTPTVLLHPHPLKMARRQHSFAAPLSPHVIADGNGRKCGVFPLRDTARRHLSDISPVLRTSRNYNQPHRVPRQPEQTKLEQYSLARRKSRDPGPQTIVTLQTGIRIQIQIRVLIPIRIRIRTGPQSQRA